MPERLTEVILETPMSFATRFYPMDGMTCLDITAGENGYLLLAQENDVMQEIALDASFQVLSRQSAAPEEGTSFSGLAGLCSWDDSYGYLLRENQICRTDGEELIVYIDLTQQNLDGAQLLRILPLTGGKLLLLWSDGFTVCTPTLE